MRQETRSDPRQSTRADGQPDEERARRGSWQAQREKEQRKQPSACA
jgi:hypothetical protein